MWPAACHLANTILEYNYLSYLPTKTLWLNKVKITFRGAERLATYYPKIAITGSRNKPAFKRGLNLRKDKHKNMPIKNGLRWIFF